MIKSHLSRLLGEKRMSQADLCRMTGIRANTISDMYNEVAERVSYDHLDRICDALECDLNELITRVPNQVLKVI